MYSAHRQIFFNSPIHQALLVVYTGQAKEDLNSRIRALIDSVNRLNISGVKMDFYPTVNTMHGLARSWIKEYCYELGYTVALMEDALLDDVDSVMQEKLMEIDERMEHLLSAYEKRKISSFYSYLKEADIDLDSINPTEIKENRYYPSNKLSWLTLKRVFEEYETYKMVNIKMDFTDFLVKFYKLLRDREDIRNRIKSNYKFIVGDEFQDASPLFIEIFKLIANDDNFKAMGIQTRLLFAFSQKPTICLSSKILSFRESSNAILNMRCPSQL